MSLPFFCYAKHLKATCIRWAKVSEACSHRPLAPKGRAARKARCAFGMGVTCNCVLI